MGHLLTVQNMLRRPRWAARLDRDDYPWTRPFYPFPFTLRAADAPSRSPPTCARRARPTGTARRPTRSRTRAREASAPPGHRVGELYAGWCRSSDRSRPGRRVRRRRPAPYQANLGRVGPRLPAGAAGASRPPPARAAVAGRARPRRSPPATTRSPPLADRRAGRGRLDGPDRRRRVALRAASCDLPRDAEPDADLGRGGRPPGGDATPTSPSARSRPRPTRGPCTRSTTRRPGCGRTCSTSATGCCWSLSHTRSSLGRGAATGRAARGRADQSHLRRDVQPAGHRRRADAACRSPRTTPTAAAGRPAVPDAVHARAGRWASATGGDCTATSCWRPPLHRRAAPLASPSRRDYLRRPPEADAAGARAGRRDPARPGRAADRGRRPHGHPRAAHPAAAGDRSARVAEVHARWTTSTSWSTPSEPLGYRRIVPAADVRASTRRPARSPVTFTPDALRFSENGRPGRWRPFLEVWALTDPTTLEPLTTDLLASEGRRTSTRRRRGRRGREHQDLPPHRHRRDKIVAARGGHPRPRRRSPSPATAPTSGRQATAPGLVQLRQADDAVPGDPAPLHARPAGKVYGSSRTAAPGLGGRTTRSSSTIVLYDATKGTWRGYTEIRRPDADEPGADIRGLPRTDGTRSAGATWTTSATAW